MYAQRCSDDWPHGPHEVPGCDGCGRTTFVCAGRLLPADIERLLDAAFAPADSVWLR
ncbi:hypothetical protein [Actinoplanes teichomyceticus]|uniref:Uncharacterized protein n=1 Tax=Actinoplanes teichomyceticus TaxID=1867 RepID=A0A561WAY6_ACTTI|nr:hypothetical protein [Actinoplanes teichomyceticus]TWG21013.1 hypothetical protein FHX34_103542 [Actinoplanes teichomyceticus]GIF14834.1 hypothetical protein Ate01nite_48660 [Actinoplanes teichomyceticus]